MGTFDIVGAYDEEVGADGDAGSPQQIQAKSLPIHYAGAGPNTVPASSSVTFTFNLNMALRPDRLVIPEAVAPSVVVNSINIGAISLNASADPAPGDMFRHHSNGRLRGAVSGSPSVPIKCTLTNITTVAMPNTYLGLQGPCKRVN
jgi:hypothetical protein